MRNKHAARTDRLKQAILETKLQSERAKLPGSMMTEEDFKDRLGNMSCRDRQDYLFQIIKPPTPAERLENRIKFLELARNVMGEMARDIIAAWNYDVGGGLSDAESFFEGLTEAMISDGHYRTWLESRGLEVNLRDMKIPKQNAPA